MDQDLAVAFRFVRSRCLSCRLYTDSSSPPDAMNEVAWCYLEGFGCKKDKVRQSGRNETIFPVTSQTQSPNQALW